MSNHARTAGTDTGIPLRLARMACAGLPPPRGGGGGLLVPTPRTSRPWASERRLLGCLLLAAAAAACADSPTAPSPVSTPPVALQAGSTATAAASADPADTPDASADTPSISRTAAATRTPRAAAWSLSVTCTKAKSTTACNNSNVIRGNRVTLAAVITGRPRGLSRKMTHAWSLTSWVSSTSNTTHSCSGQIGQMERCGFLKSPPDESKVRYRASRRFPHGAKRSKTHTIRISLTVTDRSGDSQSAHYDVVVGRPALPAR